MLIKPGVHYEITLRVTIIFSTMVAPTLQITNINRTDVWKLSSFSQNLGPMCSPWQNEAILLDFFSPCYSRDLDDSSFHLSLLRMWIITRLISFKIGKKFLFLNSEKSLILFSSICK